METTEEMLERIKEVLRDLKNMHHKNPDSTHLLISHGCFLRVLMCLLTNQQHMCLGPNPASFQANNNSLTILDFATMEKNERAVDVKLLAYNLQLL